MATRLAVFLALVVVASAAPATTAAAAPATTTAWCADITKETKPAWKDVEGCTSGRKIRYCMSTTPAASINEYQIRTYTLPDCTDSDKLDKLLTACGYTKDADTGFKTSGACNNAATCLALISDCKATCTATEQATEVFKSISRKCQDISGCSKSTYGCCPDGKTAAEGKYNQGCCQYATVRDYSFGLTGCRAQQSDGSPFCLSTKPIDACDFADAKNPAKNEMMKGKKCYCDQICDVTKDCCEGVKTCERLWNPAVNGGKIFETPSFLGAHLEGSLGR